MSQVIGEKSENTNSREVQGEKDGGPDLQTLMASLWDLKLG